MSEDTRTPEELTEEELAKANAEQLPDREQMSVIRGGFDPVPVMGIGDPVPPQSA